MITVHELLGLLETHKGSIVLTSSLTEEFIAQARVSNRIHIDYKGTSYVWQPEAKIPETEEEVKFFETWYPLDFEVPEDLKDLSWYDKAVQIKKQIKQN